MRVLGKNKILKVKRKNIGNRKLCNAIDELIADLERFEPDKQSINDIRKDADCVHRDGFYFFDINIHRTLVMIEFDENGEVTIVWVGTHQDYETTFKNNKDTIEKWLRSKGYIE
jgi:hypothetical protein